MTVAVLRDGARESAVRLREKDSPTEVLTGSGLVPGLAEALAATFEELTAAGRRSGGRRPVDRARRPRPTRCQPAAQLGRPPCRPRGSSPAASMASSMVSTLTRVSPSGVSLAAAAQLSVGRQEVLGALVARADGLHLDAADRADLALVVDGAGARDELAAGQVARGELVDDAEGEHQPGARAADVGELDVDREREGVVGPGLDADDGPVRRPRRRTSPVVIVTFSVPSGVLLRLLGRGRLLGGDDREDDVLAGLVLGDQLGDVARAALTAVPSTALITSPACSLPSAGLSLTTVETITRDGDRDVQLLQGGDLGALLGLAELLGVLLGRLLLGLAVRVERVVRHDHVVVGQPAVDGLDEVHAVVGAGDADRRHVEVPGGRVGLVPGDLQHRLAVVLARACSPSGPGDISAYGTLMSTPAQSSAISIRVEASIVAVRRGMERQYGTGLSVAPSGPVRTGTGRQRGGHGRSRRRLDGLSGLGTGVRLLHRLAEPRVPGEFGDVAGRAVPAAQLPHIAAPIAAKSGISNQASAAMHDLPTP